MRAATAATGFAVVAAASLLAFALSGEAVAVVRIVADTAAVATIGFAIVPALDTGRRRDELVLSSVGPLIVTSAVWLVAEVLRLATSAAEAAAVPLPRLTARTAVEFALHTGAGRAGLLSAAAAATVCGLAGLAVGRSPSARLAAAGVASVGFADRAMAGHLSENTWGAMAIAVHAIAAAIWCGGLVALAVTIRHRGQWARVLPRFSAISLVCVAVVLVTGIVGALLAGGPPTVWYETTYGRLLLAKVVVLLALVALGWRNRTVWVPAARSHRVSAGSSQRNSVAELTLMAVALTLAAALAVTG
jgi:putative copper resistance protein D